jgi:hypothetical protein
MIIPYNAGFNKCYEGVLTYINNSTEAKYVYKKFYDFLKNELQTNYLYNENFATFLAKQDSTINSQTGSASLVYYKMKRKEIDLKIKN